MPIIKFLGFDSKRFDVLSKEFAALRAEEVSDDKKLCILEIERRLRHCAICIRRIQALYERFQRLWQNPEARMRRRAGQPSREGAVSEEIWLISEAFYHVAWRVRELIDHKRNLGWKMPAGSIGDVRNQIFVHPEDYQLVLAMRFSHGGPGGPSFKPYGVKRPAKHGLYVHAEEFVSALEKVVERRKLANAK